MGQKKNGTRSPDRPRRERGGTPVLVWVVLSIILLATAPFLMPKKVHAKHPQPRANVTAKGIQPPALYANMPETAEVYRMAAEIPEIIDGIYCYCDCHNGMQHRSLIDCFKSEHAANCDVCQQEVRIAYTTHKEGKSLEEIRQTLDGYSGKGG